MGRERRPRRPVTNAYRAPRHRDTARSQGAASHLDFPLRMCAVCEISRATLAWGACLPARLACSARARARHEAHTRRATHARDVIATRQAPTVRQMCADRGTGAPQHLATAATSADPRRFTDREVPRPHGHTCNRRVARSRYAYRGARVSRCRSQHTDPPTAAPATPDYGLTVPLGRWLPSCHLPYMPR